MKKDSEFSLLEIFSYCISLMQRYLLCITFSRSLSFSGLVFLNWLKRNVKSVGGFSIRELIELFDSLLLLLTRPRIFWLFKLPKGKSIAVKERQYHGSL